MTRHIFATLTFILTILNSFGQCGISFTQTDALCFEDCNGTATATPTGIAPFSYEWTTGDTTQSISNLCAGTYTLTMTDSLGCTAIDNITINEPPQLLATVTILSEPSGPEACDAELSYSANGGTIPYTAQWIDCANDTVIWWPIMPPPPWYFCAGEWGVTIIDAHGCSATTCVTVIDPPTSTQELDNQIELTYQIMDRSAIFSEPINELRIFDALGHLVFTSSSGSVTRVTLPNIPSGLYILAASSNNNLKLTSKLIIQR